MSIHNQRNQFYFDHEAVRLFASTMDLRPFLAPTGWVLYIKGLDDWEMAEYGVAYSPEAAQIHCEEAKGRYLRKRDFGGRYERELSSKDRALLKSKIRSETWKAFAHDAICTVQPHQFRLARSRIRAAELTRRDMERLQFVRNGRLLTLIRKPAKSPL